MTTTEKLRQMGKDMLEVFSKGTIRVSHVSDLPSPLAGKYLKVYLEKEARARGVRGFKVDYDSKRHSSLVAMIDFPELAHEETEVIYSLKYNTLHTGIDSPKVHPRLSEKSWYRLRQASDEYLSRMADILEGEGFDKFEPMDIVLSFTRLKRCESHETNLENR
jgi:hypothetical protein